MDVGVGYSTSESVLDGLETVELVGGKTVV